MLLRFGGEYHPNFEVEILIKKPLIHLKVADFLDFVIFSNRADRADTPYFMNEIEEGTRGQYRIVERSGRYIFFSTSVITVKGIKHWWKYQKEWKADPSAKGRFYVWTRKSHRKT